MDVSLDIEGTSADEEVLVAGEPEHRVAGGHTLEFAGSDAHDRAPERPPRLRIPRDAQRWLEREDVAASLERRDLHYWPP